MLVVLHYGSHGCFEIIGLVGLNNFYASFCSFILFSDRIARRTFKDIRHTSFEFCELGIYFKTT